MKPEKFSKKSLWQWGVLIFTFPFILVFLIFSTLAYLEIYPNCGTITLNELTQWSILVGFILNGLIIWWATRSNLYVETLTEDKIDQEIDKKIKEIEKDFQDRVKQGLEEGTLKILEVHVPELKKRYFISIVYPEKYKKLAKENPKEYQKKISEYLLAFFSTHVIRFTKEKEND